MSALKQSLAISSLPPSSSTSTGNSTEESNDQPSDSSASSSITKSPGSPSDVYQPTTFNLGKRYRPTPLPTPSAESSNIEPAFGADEISKLTSVDDSSSKEEGTGSSEASSDMPSTADDSLLKKTLVRRSTGKGFRVQEPENDGSNTESASRPSASALDSNPNSTSEAATMSLNLDSTASIEEEMTEARKKIDSSKEKHKVLAAAAEDEIIAPPSLAPLETEPVDSIETELSSRESPSAETDSIASTVVPSPSEHSEPSELSTQVDSVEQNTRSMEDMFSDGTTGTPEEEKPMKNYKRDMQAHLHRMISQFGGLNMRK